MKNQVYKYKAIATHNRSRPILLCPNHIQFKHWQSRSWLTRSNGQCAEMGKVINRLRNACTGELLDYLGKWMYYYRAVDKAGHTIDFLLTIRRNKRAAQHFLIKAIEQHGVPSTITIDKSAANKQAIRVYNKRNYKKVKWRQCKYLNNVVEQDHRFVQCRIQQGLGFKELQSAQRTLTGIEVVRMIKKDQLHAPGTSTFKSFCSIAT